MKMLKKGLRNHRMWGSKVRKYRLFFFFLIMCLSLYDYQAKASRYRKWFVYILKKTGQPLIKNKHYINKN